MAHRRIALALAVPAAAVGLAVLPATAASAQTGTFTASAVGANEPRGGDTDASAEGRFRADTAAGQFCYSVTGEGLQDAAAMHIHEGPAGTEGPVVIPLDHTKIGAGEVCTPAEAALLEKVMADPAVYYLNVHTPEFQAGAVRDQLSPATPTNVNAGSGGQADGGGLPAAPLALVALGVAVTGAAGWQLARR